MRERTAPTMATGKIDRKRKSMGPTDISPPRESAAPAVAAIRPCPSLVGNPRNQARADQRVTERRALMTAAAVYPSGIETADAVFSATAGKKRQNIRHPKKDKREFRKIDVLRDKVFDATAPDTQLAQSVAPSTNSATEKTSSTNISIKHLPLL